MKKILEKSGIKFNAEGKALVTEQQLLNLVKLSEAKPVFSEIEDYPLECYVLVDKGFVGVYPFSISQLENWEMDGSCVSGEALYKMIRVKKY